jgi:hypothetical protein
MIFVETSNDRVLGLKGLVVCTIVKVGEEWIDDGDASRRLNHLSTIHDFCKESAALGHDLYDVSTLQREGAVWRVPIGDLCPRRGEPTTSERTHFCGHSMAQLYARYVQLTRYLANPEAEQGTTVELQHAKERSCTAYMLAMARMHDMRPFLTEVGYIGMGPGLMEVGDAVVIFAGADIPHVLRRTSDKHWEYVGEAYCDGVMDGEFWNERVTWPDGGGQELETFLLV